MPILDKLKVDKNKFDRAPQRPVWKGPEIDGVTFSLLSRFLCCRERFRVLVVEGLKPEDTFNHKISYGNLWHVCEESLAETTTDKTRWAVRLQEYARSLCQRYPTSQPQIEHWYHVCRVQFPLYVEWWRQHPDVTDRQPLLQEQVFDVPYSLPSGRTVRLRGKWDSVDLVGKGKGAGVFLQENKTKGDINPVQLQRQLSYDLQTMTYLVALMEYWKGQVSNHTGISYPILGVRFNVVRRPLSGGKGSIVQHKPTKSKPRGESSQEFYTRLGGIIKEDPGHFFMRWKVEISAEDVARFRRECLDPILENLCYWWDYVTPKKLPETPYPPAHWRHPFGVYNVLDEGGSSDLDTYLTSGSEIGLQRVDNLFPELS